MVLHVVIGNAAAARAILRMAPPITYLPRQGARAAAVHRIQEPLRCNWKRRVRPARAITASVKGALLRAGYSHAPGG